ncbi:MAG: molybdopterin-dependent oxidoreductase [Methylococcales bacterium]
MFKTIQTTCPYCGVGCGISAQVDALQHSVEIKGDKLHPANFGRLCSKGSALGDTVKLKGRLLQPIVHGQTSSWTAALDLVANTFKRTIDAYEPDSVAIYGSGQLLTEDYYVANKLMKGFIGSGNMDTNSRLCMSSSVSGHKRAFGSDTVPGCYEDFEHAELIVLIGSNAAWCHPVSFQRIRAAKERNPALKIIVIDPRKTASCDIADLHLPIASGRDAFLFNGLLQHLNQQGAVNSAYIEAHTEGFMDALQAANFTIAQVAGQCHLEIAAVRQFYDWFASVDKVMSLYSQGINQSSSGTDKVNAIINCHLATGRIGKPGMGPFSLTGQPNAMGGREVGGLANQLAAHMDFFNADDIDRVARFWGSQSIARKPGLAAVDLFDAIYAGKVKAVWIMGTNPVVSMPNADKVKHALQRCEFVVVSDCISNTDTTALAHVLLPAQGWSEKDGTVTNSERCISRQRALFTPAGDAQPDWWVITQVAQRMGFAQAFAYESPVDIFREHAALSGFENAGQRDFDISAFATITAHAYEKLQPTQWPVNQNHPEGTKRLFANGQFFTASGKAQFIAVKPCLPVNSLDAAYPLVLNTGRLRDQWHTMTRTALATKLNQHRPEPFVEIHPRDAEQFGLSHNGLARITSQWGQMLVRVRVTDSQKPGNLFVPMHWTEQYASQGRMGALVNPVFDPYSKQPESKHTPVNIKAYRPAWTGFMFSRSELNLNNIEYWVKINSNSVYRYELAGDTLPPDCLVWAKNLLHPTDQDDIHWQEYQDNGQGQYRVARIINQRLESLLFISTQRLLPERNWLSSLFAQPEITPAERKSLLLGLPPAGVPDVGAIICACFNVGAKTISAAIKERSLKTHQEVGQCLKAGTNCGSCIPEIKALL